MSVLTQRIVNEIESAPEPIQAEVLDFVLFVKARSGGTQETAAPIRQMPGVCGGEACIGMTRVAVWMLEDARRAGVGDLDLLKDYPGLGVYDLEAVGAMWKRIARRSKMPSVRTGKRDGNALLQRNRNP